MHLLGVSLSRSSHRLKWQISLPFHILQLVKSLPFHIPEAWKGYLFWVEPSRIGHYIEYHPPPPQTPQRVVSCIPIINDDEDLLLHLIYIMPPENCTFGSFLHKDQWTEILLANNSPQKRDKNSIWLRSRQIWLFWKLTFPDIWSFFDWLRASISIFVLSKPTSMSCNSIILLLL